MAVDERGASPEPDTFPRLLARNARDLRDRPAYREKEFGIWQSWTWGEVREEVLAPGRVVSPVVV